MMSFHSLVEQLEFFFSFLIFLHVLLPCATLWVMTDLPLISTTYTF